MAGASRNLQRVAYLRAAIWLSAIFLLEQAVGTITVFGYTGFTAPGGAMNVYLGGVIGFLWVAGVVRWALPWVDLAR